MPRSISWQPELRNIHRRVSESAQNPYTRAQIETLFRIGATAAQKLLELMPRYQVGSGIVVDRQDLIEWLNGLMDVEDLGAHMAQLRADPPRAQRRRLRVQVPREMDGMSFGSLRSQGIWMERGKIELSFSTLEDCVGKLLQLAVAMQQTDFERRYCDAPPPRSAPPRTPQQEAEAHDVAYTRAVTAFEAGVFALAKTSGRDRRQVDELLDRAFAAFAELERIGDPIDEAHRRAHDELKRARPDA